MKINSLLDRSIAKAVFVLLVIATIVPNISGNSENRKMQMNFLGAPPEEEWNKTFGKQWGDKCYSVKQTVDGGYILTGRTRLFEGASHDVWLVKTDENGDEQWNKSFGGMKWDEGCCVVQTSDYGYMIISRNAWLIKTDSSGNEQWNKTLRGVLSESAFSFQQTSDNGYIITGEIIHNNDDFDVWLMKTDNNGTEQWNKTFDRLEGDVGYSVFQTNDTGYIIVGKTQNVSVQPDVWLIKTDENGNEQWNKTFGGTKFDCGNSVLQTQDGGYIIIGKTDSFNSGSIHPDDVWLVKTSAVGEEQWNKTFGSVNYNDGGKSIVQLIDGGYLLCGYTHSYGAGWSDVWLIITNSDGIEKWNKTFGGVFWESGESVQQTADGGFITAGWTNFYGNGEEDFWLIKVANKNQPPIVTFENPRDGYFHFSGISLFPTLFNLIADTMSIGGFRLRPIIINATDDFDKSEDLIVKVYLNDEEQGNASYCFDWRKHEWFWTGWALGTYNLTITAEDSLGAIGSSNMDVWNFCFIP